MKIKVGDNVLVSTGKYKGKTGKVLKTYGKVNKVVVEKVNIRTKHIKKTLQRPGERIKYEAPFAISNVKLICSGCSKAVRVRYSVPDNGKKYRVCRKCNASLDTSTSIQKK